MVTVCFVAKSPQPTTKIFFDHAMVIAPEAFEHEVLSLVTIPDEAMHYRGLDEGDSFYLASRGTIQKRTWTWLGRYRHAVDPGGRKGAYVSAGLLLPNQICDGIAAVTLVGALDDFFNAEIGRQGRIPTQWQAMTLSSRVKAISLQADSQLSALTPGSGLSPATSRLVYVRGSDLPSDRLAGFMSAIQTDPNLQRYGRILFSPSEEFAAKLDTKTDLEVYPTQAAVDVVRVTVTKPTRDVGIRPMVAELPTVSRFLNADTDMPQYSPTDIRNLEQTLQSLKREVVDMRADVATNHRSVRINRRLTWVAVATLMVLGGMGVYFLVGNAVELNVNQAMQNAQAQEQNEWQSAFRKLDASISRMQKTLQGMSMKEKALQNHQARAANNENVKPVENPSPRTHSKKLRADGRGADNSPKNAKPLTSDKPTIRRETSSDTVLIGTSGGASTVHNSDKDGSKAPAKSGNGDAVPNPSPTSQPGQQKQN